MLLRVATVLFQSTTMQSLMPEMHSLVQGDILGDHSWLFDTDSTTVVRPTL